MGKHRNKVEGYCILLFHDNYGRKWTTKNYLLKLLLLVCIYHRNYTVNLNANSQIMLYLLKAISI